MPIACSGAAVIDAASFSRLNPFVISPETPFRCQAFLNIDIYHMPK